MAKYGTKEYYEERVAQASLTVELLEEAIKVRVAKGEFSPKDVVACAPILEDACTRLGEALQALEAHNGTQP